MLQDLVIHDAPDVNEGPRYFEATRLRPCEQRHRRCSVHTVHGHVVRDELSIGDQVVVLDFTVTKVMPNGVQDLPQSLSALRPSGVIDHVLGHQVVEYMVVPGKLSPEELLHHRLWLSHPLIVHDDIWSEPVGLALPLGAADW